MEREEFIENLNSIKNDSAKMAFLKRIFMDESTYQRQALKVLAMMDAPLTMPYKITAYTFAILKGKSGCSFPISLKIATATVDQKNDNPFDRRFDRMLSCSNIDLLVKQHLHNIISILKSKDIGIDYNIFLYDLINWKTIKNKWLEEYYC